MSNSPFAKIEDVEMLFRPLDSAEQKKTEALLPAVSDILRQIALNEGRNLDEMMTEGKVMESVVKIVTVDIVARILRQNLTGEAMSQESQSAMGYSWSGTYAVPGGGIANAIMRNDLKRLGLGGRQRIGVIETYDKGNTCTPCG